MTRCCRMSAVRAYTQAQGPRRQRDDGRVILDWPGYGDEAALFSLGRALVLAGARLLELDSRELNLELKARLDGDLGILLYDPSPWCGALFRTACSWTVMARSARKILRGSPSHDAACRRACLECLLDFGGQFHAQLLDRKGALGLLDAVLGIRNATTKLTTDEAGPDEH